MATKAEATMAKFGNLSFNYTSKPWEMTGDNGDRLRALWDEGVPIRKMAKTLNISLSTLWMATKRMDLKRRAPIAASQRGADA
jgi:hypothetical protein